MATMTAGAPARKSGWTITEGVILLIIGIAAILAPLSAASIAGMILPWVLLFEGVVLIIAAFNGRSFGGAVWYIILGLLALAAAAALFAQPVVAIASLPFILATYLLIKGIMQFVLAVMVKAPGRGWVFTSATLNVLLAVLIWAQPFGASLALTGFYIGLSILMLGAVLLFAPAGPRDDELLV